MLCPRRRFFEKSPTQRYVDLASSSTRCTSPSCDMNFGCEGLSVAWWRVSRVFLCIMAGSFTSPRCAGQQSKRQIRLKFVILIKYRIDLNFIFIFEIFDSGESLRDANTYGLAPRSVVSNKPQNRGFMLSIHRNKKNS